MNKLLSLVLASLVAAGPVLAADVPTAATASSAPVVAVRGKMLVDASGTRLAPVYRVASDGSAQIVFEGRMVTVPASTLSLANGKLTTSLAKTDVIALR